MSPRRPMMICLLAVIASACGSEPDHAAAKTTADIPTATVGDLATPTTSPDTTTTSALEPVPTFVDPTIPFIPNDTSTSTTSTTTTTIDPNLPAMCFSAALVPGNERKVVVAFLDGDQTLDDVHSRAVDLWITLRALHNATQPPTQQLVQGYWDATTLMINQLNSSIDRQNAGAALDAFIGADHHFVRDILAAVKTRCPGLKADILVPPAPGTYANAGKAMDPPPPPDTTAAPDTTAP